MKDLAPLFCGTYPVTSEPFPSPRHDRQATPSSLPIMQYTACIYAISFTQ